MEIGPFAVCQYQGQPQAIFEEKKGQTGPKISSYVVMNPSKFKGFS